MKSTPARRLAEEGVRTVGQLVTRAPFRYEDRSRFEPVAALQPGAAVAVSGRIVHHRLIRTRRRGFTILDALLDDGSGTIRARWFNRTYLAESFSEGVRAVLYGAPELERGSLILKNPEYELFTPEEEADPVHMGRVVGIYRRVAGLSSKWQRAAIARALPTLSGAFSAFDDPERLVAALGDLHFPPGGDAGRVRSAREKLAREELSALFERIEEGRAARETIPVEKWARDPAREDALAGLLPFALTAAQRAAVADIGEDFARGRPMARLLQGDVGSGKTAVAFVASLLCADQGGQAAFMAPTEVLAEQHADRIVGWLFGTRYRVELLTGNTGAAERRRILGHLAAGEIDILVGTHALIEEPVEFRRLALAIIDEQHRFGVAHRARLSRKGDAPHLLVMTATPIPRSLAWTLFGDLDVSRLAEKPPGRSPVRTHVRPASRRASVLQFVEEKLRAGERAYIVVPAIEEGESEIAAAENTFSEISRSLPEARPGLLHGRLPPVRRRRVMGDFASGACNVLVATTVIEVGVDVPEATVMVIENAERFGLAQLHQLRGRIGRGERKSHCILLASEGASPEAMERLAVLESCGDGFEIAERDLALRGPGDLLGLRQAGVPRFQVADIVRDAVLLESVRAEVRSRFDPAAPRRSDLFPMESPPE